MKIFYIANVRLPTEKAHGRQIMKMSESLAKAGEDLELIIPSRRNPKIKRLKSFDPVFILGWPAGLYIKFQTIFFVLSLTIYLIFKKDTRKSVFYTRDEILLPLLKIFNKKIVWEVHALPKKMKFLKPFLSRVEKLVVLTQSIKDRLIVLGLAENKILVSPDAVDLEIFGINLDKSQARHQSQL